MRGTKWHVDIYLETSSIFQELQTENGCPLSTGAQWGKRPESFGQLRNLSPDSLLTLAEACRNAWRCLEICIPYRDACKQQDPEVGRTGWIWMERHQRRTDQECRRMEAGMLTRPCLPDAHQCRKTEKHSYSGWLQEEMQREDGNVEELWGKGWSRDQNRIHEQWNVWYHY